jgi:hypothetical protein
MKALLFIGILILIFFHPVIGLLALLFFVMAVMGGDSSSTSSSQPNRHVVYQHEVLVRETVYASPTHYRPRRAEEPLCALKPEAQPQPEMEILAQPYRSQIYPWQMQDKLNRVNFSKLN